MSDFSKYIAAIAQKLQADDTLNALVDGQVIAGFRRAQADDYLTGANQACIGVRNLLDQSQGLPGCYYHGGSEHNQLIEIRIITKLSTTRQDDSYAGAIAARVESILKPGMSQEIGDVTFEIPLTGAINFTPLDDDQFQDRIEVQGTVRIKYYG